MTTVNDSILERIRHLLAMAEHETSNEYEAAMALEKAQELLLRHNLDRATVLGMDSEPDDSSKLGKADVVQGAGFTWKRRLLGTIARNNLCYGIHTASQKTTHVFGTRENVRAVLEMYYWVLEQLERLSLKDMKAAKRRGEIQSARQWKPSYMLGAIQVLGERLSKPLDAFRQGAGHALVLASDQALKAAVRRVFPRIGQGSPMSIGSRAAYGAGQSAGRSVTFGRPGALSGGRKALGVGR